MCVCVCVGVCVCVCVCVSTLWTASTGTMETGAYHGREDPTLQYEHPLLPPIVSRGTAKVGLITQAPGVPRVL